MTPPDEMRQGPNDAGCSALRRGQIVARFTIEALLGLGAFGATYRARDMRLGCEVVIREFLPPALATRREDGVVVTHASRLTEAFARGRRQFLNGGRILAALRAPCIVRVLECLESNGTAYIVTERLAGRTLDDRLETEGTLAPADLDRILWPLLEGLELVHSRGFFHGDINPGTIVLDAEGRPTLIDFGAAGTMTTSAEAGVFTAPEQIGTGPTPPAHMAPGRQGPWTDIYSLAATFHHALTGTPPPHAQDRVREDRYRPLMRLRPEGFSPAMLTGLDRGLGVSVRDRPQSIAQWRSILWQTARIAPAAPADPPPMLPPRLPPRPASPGATGTATAESIALWQARRAAASPPAPEPPPIVIHRPYEPRPAAETIPPTISVTSPRATPDATHDHEEMWERPAAVVLDQAPDPTLAPRSQMPRRVVRGKLTAVATGSALVAGAFAYFAFAIPDANRTEATATATTAAAVQASSAEAARPQPEAEKEAARQQAEAAARREEELRQQRIEAEQAAQRRQQEEEQARQRAEADARRQAELADPQLAQAAESSLQLAPADRQKLQAALAAQGFDPRGIDGIFGPRSRQAIATWQKSRNEPSTGFLSAAQKQALLASTPNAAGTAPGTVPSGTTPSGTTPSGTTTSP